MDEIKVGEYIRTNKGTIGQIIEKRLGKFFKGKDDDEIPILRNVYELDTKQWTTDEYIVKHSKNIIDLIEVGDIVEVQNKLDGSKTIFNLNKYIIDIYKEQIENGSIKLASILTHEMYEKNCYKVGE